MRKLFVECEAKNNIRDGISSLVRGDNNGDKKNQKKISFL